MLAKMARHAPSPPLPPPPPPPLQQLDLHPEQTTLVGNLSVLAVAGDQTACHDEEAALACFFKRGPWMDDLERRLKHSMVAYIGDNRPTVTVSQVE
jgi:hypothetical protein